MLRLSFLSASACIVGLAGGALAQTPEMVSIPKGEFLMGPAPGEEERYGVDKDARIGGPHPVTVPAFAIGKYKVTRAEYEAFVKATGRRDGDCSGDRAKSWRNPGFLQDERHPVVCANLHDAVAYAEWLSRTTGKTYRLPSEAEWEYAARGGTQSTFFWGESRDEACNYGNFGDMTYAATGNVPRGAVFPCTDGYARTSPVGKFKSNAFGLHDVLGNAWEWTADCYSDDKYENAPTDGSARLTQNCSVHQVRGGSWASFPANARAAARLSFDGYLHSSQIIGFRVARTN